MNNFVTVDVFPNPLIQNVTGGGNYCAVPGDGVPVGLSNSENGIGYKLYLNNIATPDPAINGNGLPLSFGNYTGAGLYSVIATNNITSCSSTMNGTAEVIRFEVSNWYHDVDGDGYGDPADVISDCSQPAGYITDNTDCNDLNNTVHPGAVEICGNGIDEDCNNLIDDNCGGNLNVKLFIEGFYLGNNVMQAVVDPVNYPSVCDTIILKLAQTNSPYNIFSSSKLVLDINGNTTLPIPVGANGNSYYIVIKHRNALETWSSVPVLFNQPVVTYDFTTAASKAYSNNQKALGDGNFALPSGDVNHDGVINAADLAILENDTQNFLYGYIDSDLNGDGLTESADYSLVENNLGKILTRP